MLRRHWKIIGSLFFGTVLGKVAEAIGLKFVAWFGQFGQRFDPMFWSLISYLCLLGLLLFLFIEGKEIRDELEAHRKTWKDLEDAQKARLEQFLAERYSFVDAETKKRLDNGIDKWDGRIKGVFEDCEKRLQALHDQYETRIDALEKSISKS